MTNPKKQEKDPIELKRRAENLKAEEEKFFRVNAVAVLKRGSESLSRDEAYMNLCRQYPGVPDSHIRKWQENDSFLPASSEWLERLISTDKAAQEVSSICRYLETKTDRMTVNRLRIEKAALLRALHKMEELIEELDRSYPAGTGIYDLAKQEPSLTGRIPEILLNDGNQVLIWTPRLPAKNKWANSVGYRELQELLQKESPNLPRFDQWHCDFIHVFRTHNLVGVKDADNYAYKPIIDTLTRAFRTNDAYDNFSYSMFNMPSESLKIGCYIHIYKRSQKVGFFREFEELALAALEAQKAAQNV